MFRRFLPVLLLVLCVISVVAIARSGVGDRLTGGPVSELWGNDAGCTINHKHSSETGYAFFDFFTGGGNYAPRTHCMVTQEGGSDWGWVWLLVGLNALVITGYGRIFVFWRVAYLQEEVQDRNKKLMDLAWIFLFCAICGYVSSIVLFFWPGYRLLALMLIPLVIFTWKFAANLDEFKISLGAKRLSRQLNESLHREKEELEAQVEAATKDLTIAKDRAESADRAKGEFLARMSHEIRTPMTAILGFLDIAQSDDANTELIDSSIDTIRQNSEHLLHLINDILDVSKIEAGEMTYEMFNCSIHEIISDVVEMLGHKASKKDLRIDSQIQDTIPKMIRTDPTRVRQLITNLVGNAIKFTESGKITIEVQGVDQGENGLDLTIKVEDTGIGIDYTQLDSIFERFSQGSVSTKRLYGGTGLGLTISRQIARDLGGDLIVESQHGIGSLFICTVRVGRASDGETPVELEALVAPDSTDSLEDFRFLLVEDGPDNQRLISHHFKKRGLRLDCANDGYLGIEAVDLAQLNNTPYDLILMDILMPNLDGIECTRQLRRRGITTPIVIITAHAIQEERDRSFNAGASAYRCKPIDFPELFRLCEELLGKQERPAA